MIVLSMSTSSPRGTVAIARDSRILARVAYDGGTSHAERLFAVIDEAMAHAGITRAEIDALACDIGPGSFTGVRVGVASAKGIAVALSIPVVGVGSLESMAHAAASIAAGRDVIAVVDARKGEVFAGAYDTALRPTWGPRHLGRDQASTLGDLAIERAALVVGAVVTELSGLAPPPRAADLDLPDASSIALLAILRLAGLTSVEARMRFDAALLEATYVRAPDARPMPTA